MLHTNETCDAPAIIPGEAYACEPLSRTVVIPGDDIGCSSDAYAIHALGELTSSAVYSDQTGSCTGLGELDAYPLGPKLDPESLPRIETYLVGDGALKAPFLAYGGVTFLPDPSHAGFVDTDTGQACRPERFTDGTVRCYPDWRFQSNPTLELAYAEEGCTGPRVAHLSVGTCDEEEPGLIVNYDRTCRQPISAHEAIPFEADAYYQFDADGLGDVCSAFELEEGRAYATMGEEVELPILDYEIAE